MSEVRIVYSSLEDAVDYASKARTKIDNYIIIDRGSYSYNFKRSLETKALHD